MNCLCTGEGVGEHWKEFTTLGAAGPEAVSGRGVASPRRIATLAVLVEASEAEQLELRRRLPSHFELMGVDRNKANQQRGGGS